MDSLEEQAFTIKKALNHIELKTQSGNMIPQTLKVCFREVHKLVYEENPGFDCE